MSEEELRSEYERLQARERELEDRMRELQEQATRLEAENEQLREQMAEAESQLQALKRELFGPKAEKLTKQQREQLEQLREDLKDEAARAAAVSVEVLEPTRPAEKKKRAGRPRHPLPENLETETIILEPEQRTCPHCGREMDCIDEEVSEEIDLVPAKLIRRRTVRRKRACRCGEAGVAIAPLPPRLIPQSELGLGLAVHIVLARYDDHVSLYALERQFNQPSADGAVGRPYCRLAPARV